MGLKHRKLNLRSGSMALIPDSGIKDPIALLSGLPAKQDIDAVTHSDPVEALRLTRKVGMAVNQASRWVKGKACECARVLSGDENKLAAFYDDPFWEKRERVHKEKLLLHVFMFLYGAPSRNHANYNRASAHSCALQKIYEENELTGDEIAEYLTTHRNYAGLVPDNDEQPPSSVGEELPQSLQKGTGSGKSVSAWVRLAGNSQAKRGIEQEADDVVRGEGAVEAESNLDCSDAAANVPRPTRKKPADKTQPPLKLLPREYLANCLNIWMEPQHRSEVLRLCRDKKKLIITIEPRGVSSKYELYKDGGEFVEELLVDFKVVE